MTDEARALDLDTSKPNIARVYDFWLGGKDNFAADRELAAQLLEIDPGIPKQVRENRTFLTSAAARAATDGVTQFLDLGAGLPSHPAVHEAVREVSPDARVAYVDIDPVVVSHAAALLAKGPGLTATRGDVGDPDAVLDDPAVLKVIDLGQPLCVIMAAVLHYLEPERASAAVRRYVERLPVGSWLVISVVHTNDPAAIGRIPLYTAATIRSHSPDDLAAWLAGTESAAFLVVATRPTGCVRSASSGSYPRNPGPQELPDSLGGLGRLGRGLAGTGLLPVPQGVDRVLHFLARHARLSVRVTGGR
jgi:O-methyltransferase involved in polyketide biosynthesis